MRTITLGLLQPCGQLLHRATRRGQLVLCLLELRLYPIAMHFECLRLLGQTALLPCPLVSRFRQVEQAVCLGLESFSVSWRFFPDLILSQWAHACPVLLKDFVHFGDP